MKVDEHLLNKFAINQHVRTYGGASLGIPRAA
jgi:hypothetical protein